MHERGVLMDVLQINGDPRPEWQVHCVAWALRESTEPLAIVAAKNVIFVVHLKSKRLAGCVRGHGGVGYLLSFDFVGNPWLPNITPHRISLQSPLITSIHTYFALLQRIRRSGFMT